MTTLVGRDREKQILQAALDSGESELVAVYGRRRVGKTYLVRNFFSETLHFVLTGVRKASPQEQLANFALALAATRQSETRPTPPATWLDAFHDLTMHLQALPKDQKYVLFFDELPWLASPQSRFLPALDHFWNGWAAHEKHIVVVICGSAASWMIKKVIRDKGGLHNRVTRRIKVEPFNLHESKTYLESRGVTLSYRQLIEINMVMGGIPHYLKEVRPGLSATQVIQETCFTSGGILNDEYQQLYTALFDHPHRHHQIIESLAQRRRGMKRENLLATVSIQSGGTFSNILWELKESGFIGKFQPIGGKRNDSLFYLKDEYSLFYIHWIRNAPPDFDWSQASVSPAWRAWSGLAFETICYKHVSQIKAALGVRSVISHATTWSHQPRDTDDSGAQIDLLIDRKDDCINLCEIKFSEGPFVIDKPYAASLRNKRDVFRRITGTKKSLFFTLVSVHGVHPNAWSRELIAHDLQVESLYAF